MPALDFAALNPALAALDHRLDPAATTPLAVAVSGGGDSLALLQLAAGWARPCGRSLLVLHVDHQLQAQSGQWAEQAQAAAQAAGAQFRRLDWTGEKPGTGLSAAARGARHRLLAEAARQAGARVILLGQTADDLDEADLMRREGSSVGRPREWSPSPVWPEGRDLFLLRPLLTVRRQALRDVLSAQDLAWIEDPANGDPRSARARARMALSRRPVMEASTVAPRPTAVWDGRAWSETHGALSITRSAARSAPPREIAAACLCAGGGERPPRSAKVAALAGRLAGEMNFVATLAGARIEATPEKVIFNREPGESARRRPGLMRLKAGEAAVWDGRFEVTAARDLTLQPLAGLAARLDDRDRKALGGLAPAVRRGLPAATDDCDKVSCLVVPGGPATARSLVLPRLAAFCGAYDNEAVLTREFPSRSEKACG